MDNIRNYNGLIGKTFSRVYTSINWNGEKAELIFEKENGDKCIFYHDQDCCESVTIKEIVGELSDLENSPILKAEEFTEEGVGEKRESYTWTFYKFATSKGHVDVSWIGESNGYYSESVDFKEEILEEVLKEKKRRDDLLMESMRNRCIELENKQSKIKDDVDKIVNYINSVPEESDDPHFLKLSQDVLDLYNNNKLKKAFITG
jgi:hypothetical protein